MTAPALARSTLRQAARAALEAAVAAGNITPPTTTIDSPGDWNTPPEKLPAILVRCGTEQKVSRAKTVPNFTTSVALEFSARLDATTAAACQDAIELFGAQIEQALFTDFALNALVEQFATVETVSEVTAAGKKHIGAILMRVTAEVFEDFEPAPQDDLAEVTITLDTVEPFSPTGTFVPFAAAPPYAPNSAPRTQGPDGRAEAALDLILVAAQLTDDDGNPLTDDQGNPLTDDGTTPPAPPINQLTDSAGNPLTDDLGNPLTDDAG